MASVDQFPKRKYGVALKTFDSPSVLARLREWLPIRLFLYALSVIATVVSATLLTRLLVPPAPSPWHQLVLIKNLFLPLAVFALYARLVHLLEQRRAREIEIRHELPTFLMGTLVGTSMMGVFFLALWGFGMAHISGGTGADGLASEVIASMVTAMGEELLFRLVLFRILEEIGGTTVAILLSATVFGLSHGANPGATAISISALSIEGGVTLALAYVLTRNIWFAVGIHMSWNFTEGYVFGAYNSGLRDPHSLLRTTLSGSDLLTGGAFGPEGSMLLLGIDLIVSTILMGLIVHQGGWQTARLRLRVTD
jgi:membrane protease YdiL (CAAX protease family)